jgi:hypothetical protein
MPKVFVSLSMETETIWRKLPGYSRYSVSNTGLVRNDRTRNLLQACLDTGGYPVVSPFKDGQTSGSTNTVHRLVAMAFLPPKPSALAEIDHIDRDKANNAADNLRWVSHQENLFNRGKKKAAATSAFVGVSFEKSRGKWAAKIWHDRARIFLGRFDTETEAAEAYDKKKAELHIMD